MPFNPPQIAPPPLADPWVDKNGAPLTDIVNWFLITLLPAVARSPSIANVDTPPLEQTGLNASLGATDLNLGSLTDGRYRVTVYLRITTPAGVSSSVTPFVNFTDDGVACTMTGAALTANAANQPLSHVFQMDVQAPGPIQVGTTYVSNPAGAAIYKITATAERVQ